MNYKEWIIQQMTRYYGGNKRKAMYWYVRKHGLLSDESKLKSPKMMVDEGNGDKVVAFIKLVLDLK